MSSENSLYSAGLGLSRVATFIEYPKTRKCLLRVGTIRTEDLTLVKYSRDLFTPINPARDWERFRGRKTDFLS